MPADPTPYLKRWELALDGTMEQGWVGAVFPVLRHNGKQGNEAGVDKLVLKLAGDDDPQFDNHVAAMKLTAGANMVRVVEDDHDVVLMERITPAENLTTIGSMGSTVVAGAVMNSLRTPVKARHQFRDVGDLLNEFEVNRDDYPLPRAMILLARKKMLELSETAPEEVLLHGDLHHLNILRHHNTWVAIDPDPIVADRAYEAAAFLRNPFGTFAGIPDLERFMRQRITRITGLLQCDEQRVVDWAFCRTAMAVVNNFDRTNGIPHEPWIAATKVFESISRTLDQSRGSLSE